MTQPSPRRISRLSARTPRVPTERDWERAVVLKPRLASRQPELVSDGSGLPFPLSALDQSPGALDENDPAVGILRSAIARQTESRRGWWAPRKRGAATSAPASGAPSLDGWRVAARTDDEILFARGRPPRLATVSGRRDSARRGWTCVAVSSGRQLRSTRAGVRASGWRLDPTGEPQPGDRELRVLVTEQTWAGGKRADGRLLAPDLHVDGVLATPTPAE